MIKEYTHTGKCIWCGKSHPSVSFRHKPHILPQALGGDEIGFDVCDDCNHYFGTATRGKPAIDTIFKEIFNISRFRCQKLNKNSWKQLSSAFFKYIHSQNKIVIKREFNDRVITRIFKRSLYEVFLQKYHYYTHDGNNPVFEAVRRFARYDEGQLRVFYAFNNIILIDSDETLNTLCMNERSIENVFKYGVFCFWFYGFQLYLEVIPTVFNVRGYQYLREEAQNVLINVNGNEGLFEVTNIMQIDFFMQRFNS